MKKDFRVYCDEEYIDYLKEVADNEGLSLNQLVLNLLRKKYPMPKRKSETLQQRDAIEIAKQQLESIDSFLLEAKKGDCRIQPKELYLFLKAEQARLQDLISHKK